MSHSENIQKQKDAEWVKNNIHNPRSKLQMGHPKYVMESDSEKIAAAIGLQKKSIVLQSAPHLKRLMLGKFSMKAVDGGGAPRLAKDNKYFLFSVPKEPQADRREWEIDVEASKENIRVEMKEFLVGKQFRYQDQVTVAFLAKYCANPSLVCDVVDSALHTPFPTPTVASIPPTPGAVTHLLAAITGLVLWMLRAVTSPFAAIAGWVGAALTTIPPTLRAETDPPTASAGPAAIPVDSQQQGDDAVTNETVEPLANTAAVVYYKCLAVFLTEVTKEQGNQIRALKKGAVEQQKCNEKQAQINKEQEDQINTLRKTVPADLPGTILDSSFAEVGKTGNPKILMA